MERHVALLMARVEHCLQERRVLADVDLEGVGGPTTRRLNDVRWGTIFRERRGTTCSHGLAGDICIREEAP